PGVLKPQRLIEMIHEYTNGEAVVTTDVGQHQMWVAQYYKFKQPHRWVTSGGLGTMGFGLPAAIGAQLAQPEATVVAIVGDGGFQMTLQELSVIQELNLPIKIVIVNNQALGMVRQWQEIFYEKRYSHSLIPNQPDFVRLAEAYGMKAMRATTEEEAEYVLKEAFATNAPVLLDFHVHPGENVYPMVAPGKGLHEMVGVKW
ncbi:MAG: acetolactate synthase large subunit, partial [Anoxybacillus ayderensis]|nr:acetolactate synthase large subunit [Anoxybacillus ayderensis]